MIYSLVEAQVREAIAKEENHNEDGSINWNYVDADCYMSGVNKWFKDDTAYYEAWNEIADTVEAEQPVDTGEQLTMDFLKEAVEYETYEDYCAPRRTVGLGVIPKSLFDALKEDAMGV